MNETPAFIIYEKKTKALKIIALVLMVASLVCVAIFGILELIMNESSPFYYGILVGTVFYALTLPLYFIAKKREAIIIRYNAYIKVLMRNPHNSVTEISEVCKVDPKVVVTDFDMMNRLGFFENLKVDIENRKVDLICAEEKRVFVCPICGGTNQIALDGEQICEFCGAINEKEAQ